MLFLTIRHFSIYNRTQYMNLQQNDYLSAKIDSNRQESLTIEDDTMALVFNALAIFKALQQPLL
jgi:hypothetical protein